MLHIDSTILYCGCTDKHLEFSSVWGCLVQHTNWAWSAFKLLSCQWLVLWVPCVNFWGFGFLLCQMEKTPLEMGVNLKWKTLSSDAVLVSPNASSRNTVWSSLKNEGWMTTTMSVPSELWWGIESTKFFPPLHLEFMILHLVPFALVGGTQWIIVAWSLT